ncbi:hypothetical protein AVEN_225040-1 [Araneus ventricosus]|uniref:Uncharacterized protein n=1 Tax=Araneus ventricosus TaxID=182803 RepID=A0A4Y2ISG7_ARAVE|nr:hypothetical protein AVEN_225040-1 [Araneus ventricosus]
MRSILLHSRCLPLRCVAIQPQTAWCVDKRSKEYKAFAYLHRSGIVERCNKSSYLGRPVWDPLVITAAYSGGSQIAVRTSTSVQPPGGKSWTGLPQVEESKKEGKRV